jgi:hypothetical protein
VLITGATRRRLGRRDEELPRPEIALHGKERAVELRRSNTSA